MGDAVTSETAGREETDMPISVLRAADDSELVVRMSAGDSRQWESKGRRFFVFLYPSGANAIRIYAKDNETGDDDAMDIRPYEAPTPFQPGRHPVIAMFRSQLAKDAHYGKVISPYLNDGRH
jgi:hypothetical protein